MSTLIMNAAYTNAAASEARDAKMAGETHEAELAR